MTYTQLIVFKDGKPDHAIEFRNAWGGAARIWDALFKAHVPKKHEYDTWLSNPDDRRLWDLALDEKLEMFERAVHAFTFDRHYVSNEHFGRFAADLRSFVERYPAGERVDHLPMWAKWLEDNNSAEAVGLHATSVAENPWRRQQTCPHCGNNTDETEAIPLVEGVEVYNWLARIRNE